VRLSKCGAFDSRSRKVWLRQASRVFHDKETQHLGMPIWRGGRVAEGARLESVFTGNRNVGSNPTPSANVQINYLTYIIEFRYCSVDRLSYLQ
jgi:hypothetical protein